MTRSSTTGLPRERGRDAGRPDRRSAAPRPIRPGHTYRRGRVEIGFDRAERLYDVWPEPVCIVCDGPYGLDGFPGDLPDASGLADWYGPHIRAWTERATPQTTLWFWNSELGWATVHPMLQASGWEYRSCHVWDKGIGHIAGNANTRTLRKLPVTTEVCVQYVKPPRFDGLTMQQWLRREWERSGLPFRLANEACGVANAATRKYLTTDHLWYFPPPEAFTALAAYANARGAPAGRPYFSVDGKRPFTAEEWDRQRAKFDCPVGRRTSGGIRMSAVPNGSTATARPCAGSSRASTAARSRSRWSA